MQNTLMERDHVGFGRVDSGHDRRTLMGMNEDSFVGKRQRKRRGFFLGKGNFQEEKKKEGKCSMRKMAGRED